MRFVGVALCALLLTALVARPASAAGGFGGLGVVGAGPVAEPTAALDAAGDDAVAWRDGTRVHLARRAPGRAWTPQTISRRAAARDVQLVITPAGDAIVAWAEAHVKRQSPGRVVATIARRDRPFGRPQVIAAGRKAVDAAPRMAVLADGRVVLIWRASRPARFAPIRGELRIAFRGPGQRFSRSRSLGRDGAAPTMVASSDGGAIVAWSVPTRAGALRVLRAARLPAHGHRLGRSFQFSAAAIHGARLAAGPGNVVIASWVSPRRPTGVLTTQLAPRRGPVRVLEPKPAEAAAVAFGPDGSALAAFPAWCPGFCGPELVPGPGPPGGFAQWAASGTAAGGFAAPVPVTPTGAADVSPPHPAILPTGEALIVWSQIRSPNVFEVVVSRRPPGSSAFTATETLGPIHHASLRGGGLVLEHPALAQAAGRVLVAWAATGPSGGLIVTERP
jgi:hypothetical protein